MTRSLLVFLALGCVVGTTNADPIPGLKVPIPQEFRVKNKSGVQCAWASIETCGRYMGVKATYTLTRDYKGVASLKVISAVLNQERIRAQLLTTTELEIGELYIVGKLDEGYPVVSTIYGGQHMTVFVGYDDKVFLYIDPDAPRLEIRSISRKDFLRQWDGVALVILKG